jgi:hypothetical protein
MGWSHLTCIEPASRGARLRGETMSWDAGAIWKVVQDAWTSFDFARTFAGGFAGGFYSAGGGVDYDRSAGAGGLRAAYLPASGLFMDAGLLGLWR